MVAHSFLFPARSPWNGRSWNGQESGMVAVQPPGVDRSASLHGLWREQEGMVAVHLVSCYGHAVYAECLYKNDWCCGPACEHSLPPHPRLKPFSEPLPAGSASRSASCSSRGRGTARSGSETCPTRPSTSPASPSWVCARRSSWAPPPGRRAAQANGAGHRRGAGALTSCRHRVVDGPLLIIRN